MGMHSSDLSIITPVPLRHFSMSDASLADMFSGIQLHGQRPMTLTAGNPFFHPGLNLPREWGLEVESLVLTVQGSEL